MAAYLSISQKGNSMSHATEQSERIGAITRLIIKTSVGRHSMEVPLPQITLSDSQLREISAKIAGNGNLNVSEVRYTTGYNRTGDSITVIVRKAADSAALADRLMAARTYAVRLIPGGRRVIK